MIKIQRYFSLLGSQVIPRVIERKQTLPLVSSWKKMNRICYTHSVGINTAIHKAYYSSVDDVGLETELNSLIQSVKLKQGNSAKNVEDIEPLAFDPSVASHAKSKKRSFLQKSVYKDSTFTSELVPKEKQNLHVEYFHGNEVESQELEKTTVKTKQSDFSRNSLSKYADHFSNLDVLTECEFWKLLDDLLGNCLIPNRSLKKLLQDFCYKQFPKWDIDNILKICDWWVQLGKIEISLLTNALEELSSRDDLQAHHLVQIFYFIRNCKELPFTVISKFIHRLEKVSSSLDHSELTIVCEAFIKSRNRIESKPLAVRVLKDIQLVASGSDPYSLVTMLRFLSRSYQRDHRSLQEVASVLTPMVPSVSFIAVPHIAAAFAKLRCFHHEMYNAVAERVLFAVRDAEDTSKFLRLKDIWMILWAFGRLNYYPPNGEELFNVLIEQLTKNEKDATRFPMQLVKTLIALCFLDIYPEDLISRTFDDSFLKSCEECSVPDVFKHLLILDNSVEIERPDYEGNRLPQRIRKKCLQVPHGTSSFTLELRNETRFVVDTVSQVIGGRNHLRTSPILPHIRTPGDIEISLGGEPLLDMSVEEHRLMYPSHLKHGHQRYALLIQLENNYRFTPRKLLGVHVMKKRQLARLGYKVAEVPYYEWLPLLQQSEKKRMNYIRAKLQDADRAAKVEENHLLT